MMSAGDNALYSASQSAARGAGGEKEGRTEPLVGAAH